MAKEVRASEDLMRGKIGAVKKALKEAKVFLPPEALETLIAKMDPRTQYQIEVLRDAKTARKRLMLSRHVHESFSAGIATMEEDGEVIYGEVEFGERCYSTSDYEDEGWGSSDTRDYESRPTFNKRDPYIVILNHDHIVIYVPLAWLGSEDLECLMATK